MRRYETIVIIDPDQEDEARNALLEQIEALIDQFSGQLVKLDDWGNNKLAYKIKKKPRGHYVRIDYCGTSELVNEMERRFKINDAFLKFMTVLQDKEADPEAIAAELAEEEKKAAEAEEKARLAAEEASSETVQSDDEAEPSAEVTSPETETEETRADEPESVTAPVDEEMAAEVSNDLPESDEKE